MAVTEQDKILNVEQLADYLNLSTSTIYNMLSAGQLPGHRLGKQWRFRRSAVDAWLNAQPKQAPGLRARSLAEPMQAAGSAPARLTREHAALLHGVWVDRAEQFLAIAAKPAGRTSLGKLLSLDPEAVLAIARSLELAPDAWPSD